MYGHAFCISLPPSLSLSFSPSPVRPGGRLQKHVQKCANKRNEHTIYWWRMRARACGRPSFTVIWLQFFGGGGRTPFLDVFRNSRPTRAKKKHQNTCKAFELWQRVECGESVRVVCAFRKAIIRVHVGESAVYGSTCSNSEGHGAVISPGL